MKTLKEVDPEIAELIELEQKRQGSTLELIASENYPSPAAYEAQGSILASKLAEGYPSKRTMATGPHVDSVENLAIERAKQLFGAEHANVQSATATIANAAVYLAALEPGNTILAMDLKCGGHISHGHHHHISGRLYKFVYYTVSKDTERIDYEDVNRLARDHSPKMIIAGASSYPRIINFDAFREIADEVGVYLMVDMAHIAGLVAAGLHPSPVPHADFVTSSTHKTLRGPRGGGLILCKRKYAQKIDDAVFPGLQSAPLMSVIAARAVVFKEAMSLEFKEYQRQVVRNAKTLAEELMKSGFKLVSNGTDNHLMVIDLRNKDMTGIEAEKVLESVGISVNRQLIPFDPQKSNVASGIRIGTPAMTTRGMREEEMKEIAAMLSLALNNPKNESILRRVKTEVRELTGRFPLFGDEIRLPSYRHAE